MKCFYCDSPFEGVGNSCGSCSKTLEKKCVKCDVLYEASANFCMSCGGKLEPFKGEGLVIIDEITEVDEKKEPTVAPPPDADAGKFVVTDGELLDMDDLDLEAVADDVAEDDSEVHEAEIEIELHDDDVLDEEVAEEITLEIDTVVDDDPLQELADPVVTLTPEPHIEPEPLAAPEPENALELDKIPEPKVVEITIEHNAAPEPKLEMEEAVQPEISETKREPIPDKHFDKKHITDDLDAVELESIDLSLKTREIQFTDEKRELSFVEINQQYDISFKSLKTFLENEVGTASGLSLCDDVEQQLKKAKGGFSFITGKEGVGKNFYANQVKKFIASNPVKNANVVVTPANAFDFDYMIFIQLIREIMKIKGNDMQTALKKFDKYFADALPKNKKEAISALVCLNFVPLKVKLPKNDLEHLISYVLYALSRSKPILWIINNASQLNTRSIKFFKQLSPIFQNLPISVVFIADENAKIMELASQDQVYNFTGMDHDIVLKNICAYLDTAKLPADVEKLLENIDGNMLYAYALIERLKDEKKIFEMKGSWRFTKLPDDYSYPESVVEIIKNRYHTLNDTERTMLKKVILINLYEMPKTLLLIIFGEKYEQLILPLKTKGYIEELEHSYKFTSRSLLNNIREEITIDDFERSFYQEMVQKLSAANVDIPGLNRHWLLLSFINLGGIIDKRYNSFLFSSAIYMEKLGFFEIAQRSYQTILSSFDSETKYDDFKLLLEAKNAKLWRFMELQWARIFWNKLKDIAVKRDLLYLELVAKGELLLLETNKLIIQDVVDVIKELHQAGSYEHEISFIDRTTEMLLDSDNLFDANTFALRGYKIVKDIISRDVEDKIESAGFVYTLFIRSACKLAEVNIALKHYDYAIQVLNEALEYAEQFNISYFKAKIKMLLGKIKYITGEDWENFVKEGFYQSVSGMDFKIIREFLEFFEDEKLEDREWLTPFLEYKNWINF